MTQEQKDLLLKDLCARLPYGVILNCCNIVSEPLTLISYKGLVNNDYDIDEVKPYLYPLSSMTEEQQIEFDRTYANDMQVVSYNLKNRLDGQPYDMNLGHYRHIDWLNAHHFDYRGLIEKGLALDATGLNIY